MKTGTTDKMKFKKLKRKLGLDLWGTVGVLESLWQATYANASDGAIGRLTNEDIAASLEWHGDPDALVDALVDCGWLDADPVPNRFRLVVHDWSEHCVAGLKNSFQKYKKEFASDIVGRDMLSTCLADAKQPKNESKPCLADAKQQKNESRARALLPIPTNTKPTIHTDTNHLLSADADENSFDHFWVVYPSRRKRKRAVALKAWVIAIKKHPAAAIIAAAKEFADSSQGKGEFCPMPSSWLNGECWNDDREAWNEPQSTSEGPKRDRKLATGPGQKYDPGYAGNTTF